MHLYMSNVHDGTGTSRNLYTHCHGNKRKKECFIHVNCGSIDLLIIFVSPRKYYQSSTPCLCMVVMFISKFTVHFFQLITIKESGTSILVHCVDPSCILFLQYHPMPNPLMVFMLMNHMWSLHLMDPMLQIFQINDYSFKILFMVFEYICCLINILYNTA